MKSKVTAALLLTAATLFAQQPFKDTRRHAEMAARKAERLQRAMQNQSQMTDSQTQYDVTYYSLDLTPEDIVRAKTGDPLAIESLPPHLPFDDDA